MILVQPSISVNTIKQPGGKSNPQGAPAATSALGEVLHEPSTATLQPGARAWRRKI